MAVYLLLQYGEILLDLLRVQRVRLLVVQVAQLLRLGDADTEAVLMRNGLRLSICISEVRKFAVATASQLPAR